MPSQPSGPRALGLRAALAAQIEAFVPGCEQEVRDRDLFLRWLDLSSRQDATGAGVVPDIATRDNVVAHLTASAWTTDPAREHVLMAYHNIYDSWSWLGGHADGDYDLARVARRELLEESGLLDEHVLLASDGILSLECLPVAGHVKRGAYVSSHLHLNVTYHFEASMDAPLSAKPDENKAVAWFGPQEALARSTEPWMVQNVYGKLVARTGGGCTAGGSTAGGCAAGGSSK